jgi:hypothetical protein
VVGWDRDCSRIGGDFLKALQRVEACCTWDPENGDQGVRMGEEDVANGVANGLAHSSVVMSVSGLAPP